MTTCTRILYAQCAKPADMKRLKAACRNAGRMRAVKTGMSCTPILMQRFAILLRLWKEIRKHFE